MPEPILRNAPLTNVVCEVRFDAPPPENVLELARRLEPLGLTEYAAEEGFQVAMRPGQIEQRALRRHRFADKEGSSAMTLDVYAFTFETAVYGGVDSFVATWQPVAEAIGEAIGLQARTRIGLRYVNEVPLDGADHDVVARAIKPELLPPWGAQDHLQSLSVSLHELRFVQEEGELAFRHGLQRAAPSAPPIYLLDFDHYEQRLRAFDVVHDAERLRRFNATINDVFRWSITDEKYESFEPEERPDA
jgi:uncharacterized protein (TIGR04255 family)